MKGRFFLDTNIFVYSFDEKARDKQQKAQELIKLSLKTGFGYISFQVIQEFFNVAIRKFKIPMPLLSSKEYLDKVFMQLEVVYPDSDFMKTGLDVSLTLTQRLLYPRSLSAIARIAEISLSMEGSKGGNSCSSKSFWRFSSAR